MRDKTRRQRLNYSKTTRCRRLFKTSSRKSENGVSLHGVKDILYFSLHGDKQPPTSGAKFGCLMIRWMLANCYMSTYSSP